MMATNAVREDLRVSCMTFLPAAPAIIWRLRRPAVKC